MSDAVTALMDEMGQEILDRVNADYEDSLLLIGRILGERHDGTAARAVNFDSQGMEMVIATPEGDHAARIDFAQPITEARDVTMAMFALVFQARAASGEEGQTSAERELMAMSTIRTFLTEVVAVREVNPHLREVTFGGGDLTTFSPLGPDTFLFVLMAPPGRTELGIDQSFTWAQHREMPEEDRPVGAYYTLRRWRPEAAELDVLMVLHGDAAPASAWAARAEPGDKVALWGPREAYHPPPGTDRLVLVGDETGLPAISVILEQRPDGMPATVLAEVASAAERQVLLSSPDVEVIWLHRDGAEAGTTSLLPEAVRAVPPFEGTPYVWGGAESRTMAAVRRHVRQERGLPREAVSLVAYWRHALSPATDDEPEAREPGMPAPVRV